MKVVSFENYLRNSIETLGNFKKIAKNFTETRSKLNSDYSFFLKFSMPNYEDMIFNEYIDKDPEKAIFLSKNLSPQLEEFFKKNQENPYTEFQTRLSNEIRELKSMLETYGRKEFFEDYKKKVSIKHKELQREIQEALMGKNSLNLKYFFTTKSKADILRGLEESLGDVNVELQGVSFICDVIIVILGYLEIDRFKVYKGGGGGVTFLFNIYLFFLEGKRKGIL